MSDQSSPSSTRTPEWATQPFTEFLDYLENLQHLLRLSEKGISMIRGVPRIVELLAKADGSDDPFTVASKVQRATTEAELAQREVDTGFPLLHAQAAISIWGGLEAMIASFLANWLQHEPGAMSSEQVRKLKVSLGDYHAMDTEERALYILDLLEREIQSPLKRGASRFETLLGVFGLSGPLANCHAKDLLELSQIRNVLVHRRGIVDRKLLNSCPWLQYSLGDRVVVSHDSIARYDRAVAAYTTELVVRVACHFGKQRSQFAEMLASFAPQTDAPQTDPPQTDDTVPSS